jgi:hypothetical protein
MYHDLSPSLRGGQATASEVKGPMPHRIFTMLASMRTKRDLLSTEPWNPRSARGCHAERRCRSFIVDQQSLGAWPVRPRMVKTARTQSVSGKAARLLSAALALWEAWPIRGMVHLSSNREGLGIRHGSMRRRRARWWVKHVTQRKQGGCNGGAAFNILHEGKSIK